MDPWALQTGGEQQLGDRLALVVVVLALAIPVTLLGCMSPFAIRLAVQDVGEAGSVSGRIYAISTMRSLLGTYLPVLITIPLLGSRITAVLFGTVLMIIGLVGLWQVKKKSSILFAVLALLLVHVILLWTRGDLKAYEGQIF